MKAPRWLLNRLVDYAQDVLEFPCDEVVRPDYLQRWHCIPKNRIFNIYLHLFTGDDDDRALHDHPWISLSIALDGTMLEYMDEYETRIIRRGDIIYRAAKHRHRLRMLSDSALTLFITGPRYRIWGFYPDGKFIRHENFDEPRRNS